MAKNKVVICCLYLFGHFLLKKIKSAKCIPTNKKILRKE